MSSVSCINSRRRYSALQVTPGRRLSALVPEAVVRRLSTLGLASRNSPSDCLVEQGKTLCAQYIRSRMEGEGRQWRWRASGGGAPWAEARLVFPRLSCLGRHLERARPRLYAAIGRHAESTTDIDPADMVYSIGIDLFKTDITWGKVVSLMAVCGALANGASKCGRNEVISTLVEAASASMQGSLTTWLQQHGGWLGLVEHCQPMERTSQKPSSMFPTNLTVIGGVFLLFLLIYLFKFCVL